MTWILRHRGHVETEKVTGIEFIPLVASRGLETDLRHFFYGGAPGVAVRAGLRLEQMIPGVHVVGAAAPPFGDTPGWAKEELRDEVLFSRSVFKTLIYRAGADRQLALRTLIVGTNEEARRLREGLTSAAYGLVPVGSVAVSNASSPIDGFQMVGGIEELEEAIRRSAAECVFVASTAVSENDIVMVSAACRRTGTELKLSTNVSDIVTSRLSVESIDGYATFAVKPARLEGRQAAFKRCFDLVVGSTGLLLTLPLIGIVTVVIRLTSQGPAFFRQVRITKDGRAFTMNKFRTMVTDPERVLEGRVIDLTSRSSSWRAILGSRELDGSFALRASTSCRSSGTSSEAT